MTACPHCGSPTAMLAGIVLYEHLDRNAYPYVFDVCWKDNLHRQRGTPDWRPLGQSQALLVLEWTEHTCYHSSMFLHGEQLHWWPTKKKVSWKGAVRKGFDSKKALELARRIADDASLRL